MPKPWMSEDRKPWKSVTVTAISVRWPQLKELRSELGKIARRYDGEYSYSGDSSTVTFPRYWVTEWHPNSGANRFYGFEDIDRAVKRAGGKVRVSGNE